MKSYIFFFVSILLLSFAGGCKKDHHHEQTKYPDPNWQADNSAAYPYSMTAVVQLPDELQKDMTDNDEIAAFVGSDCRGVGVIVKRDGLSPVFYILIHGGASEQSKVDFRYYSSKNSYLFTTDEFLGFAVDDNYGVVDEPAIPLFQAVN